MEPEEISAGQRLESRLDIPSYENEGVYVNALHEPRKNVNKGGAGKAVAYTATTVMDNVDFGVYENAALNIAAGSSKGTIATMQGDYVPMTTKQAYDLANGAIKNPEWTEIGMNPIRHSYFYDKATQTPIKTAEQVVQIGALVLAKNVVKGDRSEYRFLPEGLPKNYQSNKDEGYLRSSIGIDGLINLYRPFKSTEALPTVNMRHDYPMQDFKIFKFDKKASVVYAKNKNGVDISFKFDPLLMNKPEFADFDTKYKGMVVQLAMADRHGATDGDMGGHSFPDLKVNQDNIVTDENGKEYKLVWSNNAWGPVKNMSSKAQKFGAVTLLTYNMDPHAHDSNTRTVRILSLIHI